MEQEEVLNRLREILDKFHGQMVTEDSWNELYNGVYWLMRELEDTEDGGAD